MCACPQGTNLYQNTCITCAVTDCLLCQTTNNCTSCQTPFVPQTNGQCGCPINQIQNGTTCVCPSPFVLNSNNYCGCPATFEQNGTTCICPTTTTLYNNVCYTCMQYCTQCQQNNVCSQCISTFVVTNNSCACPDSSY